MKQKKLNENYDNMIGEEFNDGRMFVMNNWDEHDPSYWKGILNALRSQGIREAKKKNAEKNIKNFIETL